MVVVGVASLVATGAIHHTPPPPRRRPLSRRRHRRCHPCPRPRRVRPTNSSSLASSTTVLCRSRRPHPANQVAASLRRLCNFTESEAEPRMTTCSTCTSALAITVRAPMRTAPSPPWSASTRPARFGGPCLVSSSGFRRLMVDLARSKRTSLTSGANLLRPPSDSTSRALGVASDPVALGMPVAGRVAQNGDGPASLRPSGDIGGCWHECRSTH